MKDAIAFTAVRPDQQKHIVPCRNGADAGYGLTSGIDIVPVHLNDHIAWLQAGI